MKKTLDNILSSFSDKPRKSIILVACILLSSCATFTGFLDMVSQESASVPDILVASTFTLIVQYCVWYFAKKSWETRLRYHYSALGFAVFISVIFGWGFYFNVLSLDRLLANQTYTIELNNIRNEISFNKAQVDNLIRKIHELVIHSQNMVQKESRGEHTCDVTLKGYGPRAAFRQQDQEKFTTYEKSFMNTSHEFNKIEKRIVAGSRDYSIDNAEALNGYIQKMNVVVDEFNREKTNLLAWLRERIRHNKRDFTENFSNGIWEEYIRCPDHNIQSHYNSLSAMAPFNRISTVDIINPDRKGVQVLQVFYILRDFDIANISPYEFIALLLGMIVDFIIFILTYSKPRGSPPSSFSSWDEYFSMSEHEALTKFFVHGRGKKGYFYIPRGEKKLIALLLPPESDNVLVFKGKVSWWKKLLTIPTHIRKQGDGLGFNQYQISVHCIAKWVCDWKSKQQRQTVALHNMDDSYLSSSNGSAYKSNADLIPNIVTNTKNLKSSLNGNSSRGIENAIQ